MAMWPFAIQNNLNNDLCLLSCFDLWLFAMQKYYKTTSYFYFYSLKKLSLLSYTIVITIRRVRFSKAVLQIEIIHYIFFCISREKLRTKSSGHKSPWIKKRHRRLVRVQCTLYYILYFVVRNACARTAVGLSIVSVFYYYFFFFRIKLIFFTLNDSNTRPRPQCRRLILC